MLSETPTVDGMEGASREFEELDYTMTKTQGKVMTIVQ